MFWLVLYGASLLIIPEKYGTLEQCEAAGRAWKMPQQFACIPAVKPTMCRSEAFGPNAKIVCE